MKKIFLDTYVFLAAATDTLTSIARDNILRIKTGRSRGVIHSLIVYEILYHWYRGRIPGFISEEEILTYLNELFINIELTYNIIRDAVKVKIEGDKLLKEAEDILLHERKLSACDAITISLCKLLQIPIITGDKDLKYVAEKLNIEVLW